MKMQAKKFMTVLCLAGSVSFLACEDEPPVMEEAVTPTPTDGSEQPLTSDDGMSKSQDGGGESEHGDMEETGSVSGRSATAVYFGFDEYTVSSEGQKRLETKANELKTSGEALTIEGHCDSRGAVEYNLGLGERRAQAVKSYLEHLGVDGSKLKTISYGKGRPASEGHTPDDHALNRRVEFSS
jgi:peptidoglycan-associated lipoprotein